LARGLARLGLIDSVGATYDCGEEGRRQCPQLSLYYLHGLGHGIGLEVHDPDRYYYEQKLGLGSVFTIEPGVYVRGNLTELLPATPRNARLVERLRPLVAKYADIGVRIEDDYVVTAEGLQWLTKSPREIPEIEAAMAARRTRSTM
jgi:Xaa-Pro aminopeptidase